MLLIKSRGTRNLLKYLIPFAIIPGITLAASFICREKSYSFAALVIAVLSLILFSSGFERKKTGSRKMVVTAIMTALAVAGRFIFTPVPGVNPITAFSVISGIYLGPQAGFFTGSISAVISNLYAGEGVWTPFQMLAWGLTGFIAGLIPKMLSKHLSALCVYAAVSAVLFSLLMDIWTVLWYNNSFSGKLFIAAITSSLPFTIVYIVSNIAFLLLLSKSFGKKLERIKVKYGV